MDTAAPPPGPLAAALGALSSPLRIDLLRQLRTPKILREIDLRSDEDRRPLARQTVREHLERLIDSGLVISRETERGSRSTTEYFVNHQVIFTLAEEVRALARIRPAEEPGGVTAHGASRNLAPPVGPCLVLVKGIDEGTTFDLTPPGPGRADWVLGRRRGVGISLDFDPAISAEHALVAWEGGAYFFQDLDSTNGSTLNFRPLAAGEKRALRHGDLVGVGRAILEFRL